MPCQRVNAGRAQLKAEAFSGILRIQIHCKSKAGKNQVNCRCCNGETKKFGKFQNVNRLVQRYRCLKCGTTFSESQPLDGMRVDFKQACQVVQLLCESMGIRAIQRITGLHQETILGILETAGQKAAAYLDAKIRNVTADMIQADEIHTTVYSKQHNTPMNDFERGEQYAFISVDRRSKLIINWFVGKRTTINTIDFLADLKGRMANRFQLTTDNWSAYSSAVPHVFGNEIDYATETKFFAKDKLPLFLESLQKRPDFAQQKVNGFAILRDANGNAQAAFTSVQTRLQQNDFPAPDADATISEAPLRVGIFIVGVNGHGMIEDLCLNSVADRPEFACVDGYFNCINQKSGRFDFSSKAKVRVWMASHPDYNYHVGLAADAGYWPWDSAAFDSLKNFLQAL